MRRFWCSLFILPKSVIYECEKTLRRFLWDSLRDTRKPGKVKWAVVCRPLEDGGLGIKDLTTLNKALILKQLWVLLIDHNSLWAKRRLAHHIRGKSFLNLPGRGNKSWFWRKILLAREEASSSVLYVLGNVHKFSLWFYPWFHGTSIHALFCHVVIHDSGLRCTDKVELVIQDGRWKCRRSLREIRRMSNELIEISNGVQYITISHSQDSIFWLKHG
ncbi:hypothetical protein CFOL_v3_29857 [Cephalotus follicularis]|uniref:Zf-RVT domain-containing protein n=1 Tax=Cephalotus follicularis TaxID=3775 RepID=A0A1Q3D1N8_CEPFO|nr:hypothetical protein CFOL_v3_29857 [Cephalotus follicularis]